MAKPPAKSPAELLVPCRTMTLSGVADGAEGLIVADLARAVAAKPNAPATSLLVVCRDVQRVPSRDLVATQSLSAAPGNMLAMDGVTQWLELNGYNRTSAVREPGDY